MESMPRAFQRKKIAILVPNPCNPDYRVIKYAELFSKNNFEVRIYCRWTPGLPSEETINGILYVRSSFTTPIEYLKRFLRGSDSTKREKTKLIEKISMKSGAKSNSEQAEINACDKQQIDGPKKRNSILEGLSEILRNGAASATMRPLRKLASHINRTRAYKFQPKAFTLAHKNAIIEWCPDVVHCHDWPTLELGEDIKLQCNSLLIFDSHELETHRSPPLTPPRKIWIEEYERRLLPICDIVTTVCDSASDYLEHAYGIARPHVIVNAPIAAPELTPTSVARWGRTPSINSVRAEGKISSDDFLLVMVGNMTYNRGVETMLEALPLLPATVKVALVGKIHPDFQIIIDNLVAKYAIENRVKIIPPVNPVCLVDFLKDADAGVIPIIPITLSYEYALPNKLFECVFAGLPIIASNITELRKITDKYELGSLFNPGDEKDLSKKILETIATKHEARPNNRKFIQDLKFETSVNNLIAKIRTLQNSKEV